MNSLVWIPAVVLCLIATTRADSVSENFWPQWRGPLVTGFAPHAQPPLNWSETKNIKWKSPIPGEGDSTPVVWADRIFLLAAVPASTEAAGDNKNSADKKLRFTVLCLDRQTGK